MSRLSDFVDTVLDPIALGALMIFMILCVLGGLGILAVLAYKVVMGGCP